MCDHAEANSFGARDSFADKLGELDFRFGGGAERSSSSRRGLDGGDDGRGGMAQDQRPPGADVVDVTLSVGIGDAAPVPAHDEGRGSPDWPEGANGRVDAARNDLLRPSE